MNKILSILLLFLITNSIWSQNAKIDSLQHELAITNQDSLQAEIFDNIGREWMKANNDSATKYYLFAIEKYKQSKSMYKTLKTVDRLSALYYSKGDMDNVFKINKMYFNYFKQKEYTLGYLETAQGLSLYYAAQGTIDSAIFYSQLVIEDANIQDSKECLLKIFSLVKRAGFFLGDGAFIRSQHDLDTALVLIDTTSFYTYYSILATYGDLYQNIGDKNKAFIKHSKALLIAKRSENPLLISNAQFHLAIFYLYFKDYKKAEEHAAEGLRITEEMKQEFYMLNFHEVLSEIYISTNQIQKAENSALFINQNALKFNLTEAFAFSNQVLGRVALTHKNYKQAKKYCNESWNYFKNANTLINSSKSCKCLSEAYEGLQQTKEALFFYRKHIVFSDSLNNKEEAKKVLEIKSEYQLDAQERQLKSTQAKKDLIASQKIQTKNQLIIGISIVAILLLALAFFVFKSSQQKRETEIATQNEQAQEIFSQQLLQSQEDERVRISRELHDSVGQDLILIKNKAQLNSDKELEIAVAATLNNVREITQGLHPFVLEKFGLTTALKKLVNRIDKNTDIFITEEIENVDNLLSKQQELGVYRIVQESMNNIIKHANSPSALISAKQEKNAIVLIVRDYGKGFDWSAKSKAKNSLGMKTLQERAKILNAKLNIDSELEKGTTIYLKIPIQNA